jgi:hypothetical protein
VLLGLQALLWGGGSTVEARAAAESLTRVAHVEDESTTACPPLHSHLDCLICRTLSGGATSGTAHALVPASGGPGARPVSSDSCATDTGRYVPLGSRAPPSA